jgi:hypothetical protein
MNDLRMLQDLTGDAPLADPADLAPARARLSAAMSTEGADRTATVRPHRRFRPVRRLLWSTAAVGVTAAVAAALLVVQQSGRTADQGTPRLVNADAARVLNAAAAAALKLPDATPRPDQFIYQKFTGGGTTGEAWYSVDGTRDGVAPGPDGARTVLPGCRDGVMQVHGNYHGTRPTACTPDPKYRTDLPTDADAMLDYLKHHVQGDPDDINAVGKTVLDLVSYDLPPRTRAALYQAAARFPGLHVDRDAVDGAGRHGIAITWHYTGGCAPGCERDTDIIFDPASYAVLGSRNGKYATALLQVAIVNTAGQRP